jgi:hypothetical protein
VQENLSEFLKIAYKYGKVKDLEEAFEDFPVEEEWHKGKVENVIKEDSKKYEAYDIGDIVFVSVYVYPDGRVGNNHLFVIIDKDNTAIPIEYFGMILSSQIDKLKFSSNKLLKKDAINNLNKDSIVKTDIIYRLYDKQILFKIGKIDKDKVDEYKKSFYDSLKDNN